MRHFLPAAITIAILGATSPLRAAEPALERLVPDDVALVFELRNLPALRNEFSETGAGRAWADPDIARFFAPLAAEAKIAEVIETMKAEIGYTPTQLLDFATGDVLATVPASSLKLARGEPDVQALIAIEVGDNENKLRELMATQQKNIVADTGPETTEDYNGVTLHLHAPASPEVPSSDGASAKPEKPFVWALHQGRWFLSTDRALVTGALDALAAGGLSTSLAVSPEYQKAIDRSGGRADALLYLNWKAVYPVLIAAIESARDPNEKPNRLGIEPAGVLKALGLDAIESFSLSAAMLGGTSRYDAALTYSEARGLAALLAYRDGPVPRPDWVPAAWFNVTSQNFSLAEAYAELERIVDRISPVISGAAQGQIRTLERQLALDLKRDVIGNIGTSFISAYSLPAGASPEVPPPYDQLDQFIAVSLADAGAFERAVETIKARFLPPGDASPLKKRDYLGRSLYSVDPGAGGRGFSYAITDGWLLLGIGSPGGVESVIQAMNAPDPSASFWQRKDVRAALADVPPGAFSIQHTDLAPFLASVAASLGQIQEQLAGETGRFVDPAATPTREQLARFFQHAVSHGTRTSTGIYFHSESPAR